MCKFLFTVQIFLFLPFSASAGVIGGGGNIMSVDSERMMLLEQNLSNSDYIRIKDFDKPVRSLQDFQTSNGQRGIVVETIEGLPIIVLESEDHSTKPLIK